MKLILIIISIGCLFISCNKPKSFVIPDGTYDWVSTDYIFNVITPDSIGKNYSFVVESDPYKIYFYEDDKLILKGKVKSVQSYDPGYSMFRHSTFLVGNSQFHYTYRYGYYELLGFPFNFTTEGKLNNLEYFGDEGTKNYNKFVKRP
jgi:hypothetical protein